MDFKQFENRFVLRLDEGEEIVKSLTDFCTKYKIESGFILGIGYASDISVGIRNAAMLNEIIKEFTGELTITSLNGNISLMNDKIYLNIHINFSDHIFKQYGGRLKNAFVKGTCEIIVVQFEEKIDRQYDTSSGLNIYKQ
jgi:uncharacterized protein